MKTKLVLSALSVGILIFSGCAQQGVEEVEPGATQYVMQYRAGIVESIRPVVIKDNGNGTFLGAITGGVLGSLVGNGKGNSLATLAGGLAGAYAGSQAGKANAQELTIELDNGNRVVAIAKGLRFYPGERIRIVMRGDKISSVEPF